MGRRGELLVADLSEEDAPAPVVAETLERLGGLDVLMNNAAGGHYTAAIDTDAEIWDRVLPLDLRASFLLCREAGRHLVAQGRGKVINVASILGLAGDRHQAAYVAAEDGSRRPHPGPGPGVGSLRGAGERPGPGVRGHRHDEALLREPPGAGLGGAADPDGAVGEARGPRGGVGVPRLAGLGLRHRARPRRRRGVARPVRRRAVAFGCRGPPAGGRGLLRPPPRRGRADLDERGV